MDVLKIGQKCRFEAFGMLWQLEKPLKTVNFPVLEPFLKC
jgi:hypothetical protein